LQYLDAEAIKIIELKKVKLTGKSEKKLKLGNKNKEEKREILKKTKKDDLLKLETSYFDRDTKQQVTTTVGKILIDAKKQIQYYEVNEKSKTVVKYVVVFIDQYFIAEEIIEKGEQSNQEDQKKLLKRKKEDEIMDDGDEIQTKKKVKLSNYLDEEKQKKKKKRGTKERRGTKEEEKRATKEKRETINK